MPLTPIHKLHIDELRSQKVLDGSCAVRPLFLKIWHPNAIHPMIIGCYIWSFDVVMSKNGVYPKITNLMRK